MKQHVLFMKKSSSFVTIWIFARMKQNGKSTMFAAGFVTIWIFARMKLKIEQKRYTTEFCYHMDFC